MNNINKGLPSLDLMDVDDISSIDVKLENTDPSNIKESILLTYRQFELDQQNRRGVTRRTDSPVITMNLLQIAPQDFFEKFKSLTKSVSTEIINAISITEATIHISNHKKDPTNNALKETILYIVMSEFNKIDRVNDKIKTLKPVDKDILLALVINEIIGLGPLEPLWNDSKVTEIMVNGPKDIQVEINGIVRKIPSASFRDQEHLKTLINKLYSSINKQLSPVNPRERGRLHDNSRMYAVHEVICPHGPNFNIRKHSEKYWSVLDIINQGTASPELMEDLGNMLHAGVSYLVVGGTGTGKTTLLNALTGFIPENARVVTMEENLEMKPHPRKLLAAPMECVPARAGEGKEFGVTMRDLVRSSLQMRPDFVFIGEVSDGAAYDLCQAFNTGHSGGSTLHANDSVDSVNRIRSLVSQEDFVRGPAVLDLIGSAFDIIIVVDRMSDGKRRITEVVELGRTPIKASNGELTLNITPLWDCKVNEVINENGVPELSSSWTKVSDLSPYRQNKHRLNLIKPMSWEQLLEISTYNVSPELREGVE